MASGSHQTRQSPEPLNNSISSMHQHQLGSLTFNSASKQDLVNTINRWMIDQQAQDPLSDTDKQPGKGSDIISDSTLDSRQSGFCIGYINPHVFNLSLQHANVHEFLSLCDLVCIDGLGTSLALRLGNGLPGTRPVHRVVALNLFDALVKQLSTPASAVLIGVNTNEVEQSARNINSLNSAFNIVDVMNGFANEIQTAQFLKTHKAIQWVLIGAGTPKSESIALAARKHCPNAIIFHIGAGTIKVYAGSKRRAPQWISDYGFEWAHRMIFEPHTRERYTRGAWRFVSHLLSTKRSITSNNKIRKQP